jgi:hypothetical protein
MVESSCVRSNYGVLVVVVAPWAPVVPPSLCVVSVLIVVSVVTIVVSCKVLVVTDVSADVVVVSLSPPLPAQAAANTAAATINMEREMDI